MVPHGEMSAGRPPARVAAPHQMNRRIHLLSCGDCRRQLDVTDLELGDEVQCVCGRVLAVGAPQGDDPGSVVRPLRRRGERDGRGLQLLRRSPVADGIASRPPCARSARSGSRTTRCTARPAASSSAPARCRRSRGGACPRCDGRLRVHLLPSAEVVECADGCGGLWCTRETFERLQKDARHAAATGATAAPAEEVPASLGAPDGAKRQYVPCLTCGQLMQRRMFRHDGRGSGIVLDVCRDHGVWFDADELSHALAFVRSSVRASSGLDGSRGSEPARRGVEASGRPASSTGALASRRARRGPPRWATPRRARSRRCSSGSPSCPGSRGQESDCEWSTIRLPSQSRTIARCPWGPIMCVDSSTSPPSSVTLASASRMRPSTFR